MAYNMIKQMINEQILDKDVPHQRYPYFDVVVGFAWSRDPESYANGSIPTGKASHAGQVKCGGPD
jgi:hypothetical protein